METAIGQIKTRTHGIAVVEIITGKYQGCQFISDQKMILRKGLYNVAFVPEDQYCTIIRKETE